MNRCYWSSLLNSNLISEHLMKCNNAFLLGQTKSAREPSTKWSPWIKEIFNISKEFHVTCVNNDVVFFTPSDLFLQDASSSCTTWIKKKDALLKLMIKPFQETKNKKLKDRLKALKKSFYLGQSRCSSSIRLEMGKENVSWGQVSFCRKEVKSDHFIFHIFYSFH